MTQGHPSRRFVVFVGAGISRAGGLPLFADLRAELFANVFDAWWLSKGARNDLTESVAALAPEYAVSMLENGADHPRAYICERMGLGHPAYEHRLLAHALARGAHVYTPNFDGLIEDAAGNTARVAIRRTTTDEPSPDANLFKLHGSCPDITVAAEEVLLAMSPSWADALATDCGIGGTHLLVWGYRGADLDLRPVVLRAVNMATTTTWLAFSEEDQRAAEVLVGHLPAVTVIGADGSIDVLRETARDLLDPDRVVDMDDDAEIGSTSSFTIRSPSTRAAAIAHLGSARLGRWAWMTVSMRGDTSAARRVLRSLLFDSRVVQSIALRLLPRIAEARASAELTTAVLTAAEGRGVRPATDGIINRFRPMALAPESGSLSSVEVRARLATLLRERGRLDEATELLDAIDRGAQGVDVASLSANWRGWVTYERAIVLRTAGRTDEASELLSRFDTANPVVVGANWGMWLEDEQCALAIERGDVNAARAHLLRAHELAKAYGQHRLAMVDLAIRELQLGVIEGIRFEQTRSDAAACERQARRNGVLSQLRHAWIVGVVADAARHAGERAAVVSHTHQLLSSPDLMQQVAAALVLRICDEPIEIDVETLLTESGESRTGNVLRALMSGGPVDAPTRLRVNEWADGSGFLFY